MEIQYEKFNKWKEVARSTYQRIPDDIFSHPKLEAYINGTKEELTTEEIEFFENASNSVTGEVNGVENNMEWEGEIDLNIANISTADQVTRYLKYLKKENLVTIDILKEYTYYHYIKQSRIDFDEFEFTGKETVLLDGSIVRSSRSLHKDALSRFLSSCMTLVGHYEDLDKYIQNLLNPEKEDESNEIQHNLDATSHRLVMLHKLGIFEALYKQHYTSIGTGGFAKLIGQILNVQKEGLESLRSDIGKLLNELNDPQRKPLVQTKPAIKAVNATLAEIGIVT